MTKNFAIVGDKKRCNDVIKTLEMLGGINECNCKGNDDNMYYFINKNTKIITCDTLYVFDYMDSCNQSKYEIMTLDKFNYKYHFKIGDKVSYKDSKLSYIISDIKWKNNNIEYTINYDDYNCIDEVCCEDLKLYNEVNEYDKDKLLDTLIKQVNKANKLCDELNEVIKSIRNIVNNK